MTAPKIVESKPHLLRLWVDGETFGYDVECPYAPDDMTRPCRMFEDFYESDEPSVNYPGCGVQHYVDEAGNESVEMRARLEAPPVEVAVGWDEYPTIEPWAGVGRQPEAEKSARGLPEGER